MLMSTALLTARLTPLAGAHHQHSRRTVLQAFSRLIETAHTKGALPTLLIGAASVDDQLMKFEKMAGHRKYDSEDGFEDLYQVVNSVNE